MKTQIIGSTLPVLEVTLEPNDKLVAEAGEFSWMTQTVQMKTTTQTAGAKGLMGVFKRAVGGGGLFMTEYSATGDGAMVAFAAKLPGNIVPVDVAPGREYMIHKHGFVCGTEGIELSAGFQRSLGAGIFGGDGFILQKMGGTSHAFVALGGEIVTYDLAPGQSLSVHPGHVGMFEASVNFDITIMKGFMNAIFGGDGLFVARLTGPGKVWLQSLTMPNLAQAIAPYLPSQGNNTEQNATAGVAGAVAGSIVKGLFSK